MTLQAKPPKAKTCAVCKTSFMPARMGAKVCSPFCAMTFARSVNGKAAKVAAIKDKRETKVALVAKKGRGYWMARAQKAFNLFIRLRDQAAGYACISSGRPLDWTGNKTDAGHFRSVGSAPHLRFDERNVHAQSKYENRFKAGNAPGYRLGLIARYGIKYVEAVECKQAQLHLSIDDIKEIEQFYTAKNKATKAQL